MSALRLELPRGIAALCEALARSAGVEALALGGSRATGTADAASDWDIGVYYRGDLSLGALTTYGEVHAPGSWGRIMNGGAWLTIDGAKVDVLLRDLDIVQAVACRRRMWVVNEKLLPERTGFGELGAIFTTVPDSRPALVRWVDHVRQAVASVSDRAVRECS